jgi:transcriptional regulator
MLVTHGSNGLDANHLPFELDAQVGSQGILRCHVARSNPLWRAVENGASVLVVFRAEEAYVSPNWYPGKHENPKQVPTWNYSVVHVHGHISVHDDEKYVRGVVARLTRTHEAAQRFPWKMTDAPPDYIDAMLKAIVGIEIEITRVEGKFKLSQNRDTRDRIGAGEALIAAGNVALGKDMLEAAPPGHDS